MFSFVNLLSSWKQTVITLRIPLCMKGGFGDYSFKRTENFQVTDLSKYPFWSLPKYNFWEVHLKIWVIKIFVISILRYCFCLFLLKT